MRFHILKTLSHPKGYMIDCKTNPNLQLQGKYLVDQETGIMYNPVVSSDNFVELTNILIDMRINELENKLTEEYYAKRKQSY
jgi:hypothetical protein